MRLLNRFRIASCVLALWAYSAEAVDFAQNVAILRNYQENDEKDVILAIQQLSASQDKRAIGPLSELLGLGPGRVQLVTAARQALVELGAMDVFAQKLRTGTVQEKQETVSLLSYMGSPALPLLVPVLSDPSPELRATAVVSLGILAAGTKEQVAVDGLIKALSDKDPYVQESAVLALGNLGSAQAIDALVELLRRGELVPQVGAAFESIAKVPTAADSSVQAIQPLLQDSDLALVERGVGILRNLGVPQAKAPLIAALKHPSPRIRFAVVHALVPYGGDPEVQSAVKALQATETDSLVRTTVGSFLAGELNVDQ